MTGSAAETATPPQAFGSGSMPQALDRLNWNAVVWGGLWALVYGVWTWFWLFVGLGLVQMLFFIWFNRVSALAQVAALAVPVYALGTLVGWLPAFWLGFVANRTLWSMRQRRPSSRAVPIESFLATQREWAIKGFALLILGELLRLISAFQPHIWSTPGYIAGTAVQVCTFVAVWLWSRRMPLHSPADEAR